jgi:hypothetical protein
MPAAVNAKSGQREAANELKCKICNKIHEFKLTKSGFIIANNRYIKIVDDEGLVNYFAKNYQIT